jgi:[ribosomal protein S5]-alanine N-acetyltransferase
MVTPSVFTKTLHLRSFQEKDIQQVFEALSDPDLTKYYGVRFLTLESTRIQMDWFKTIESNGTGRWWAITDLNTAEFYGGIGFSSIDRKKRTAEIGFWLLKKHHNKGIMSEALEAAEKHGFQILQLMEICALVAKENLSSQHLLKKRNYASNEKDNFFETTHHGNLEFMIFKKSV